MFETELRSPEDLGPNQILEETMQGLRAEGDLLDSAIITSRISSHLMRVVSHKDCCLALSDD